MQPSLVHDNPLLVKHMRSRLRGKEVWPSVLVVGILGLLLAYATPDMTAKAAPSEIDIPFRLFVGLQGIILFLLGTGQVFGAVFRAKESSVLDFHRISPLSSLTLCLGFVLGAPVREYLMFAVTLPFSAWTIACGAVSPLAWLLVTLSLPVAAMLYHLFALAFGLMAEKGKSGIGAAAAVLFLYLFSAVPPVTYFTIVPAYKLALQLPSAISEWNVMQGPFGEYALALLHQALFIGFLLLGAVRKMRQDESSFWSKPLAVLFYFLLSRLAVLDLGRYPDMDGATGLICLYVLLALGLVLTVAFTPPARDVVRGLRRADKLGQRLGLWMDAAPNWLPLLACCGLYAVTLLTLPTSHTLSGSDVLAQFNFPLAVVAGACVFFYFGSALQTALLRYKKQGRGYFLLFLFVLWLVPIMLGGVASLVHGASDTAALLWSLSPICGLGMIVAGNTAWTTVYVVGLNATLAGVFALVRRQDERQVHQVIAA